MPARLFDHLVGGDEQRGRHSDAEHPCGLMVDDQLEPARLYDRQIGRLRALEPPTHDLEESAVSRKKNTEKRHKHRSILSMPDYLVPLTRTTDAAFSGNVLPHRRTAQPVLPRSRLLRHPVLEISAFRSPSRNCTPMFLVFREGRNRRHIRNRGCPLAQCSGAAVLLWLLARVPLRRLHVWSRCIKPDKPYIWLLLANANRIPINDADV